MEKTSVALSLIIALSFHPLDTMNDLEARLIMPDGLDGRMFIVYPNYKNILYYNCSSYYAVSVGLLSDKISN